MRIWTILTPFLSQLSKYWEFTYAFHFFKIIVVIHERHEIALHFIETKNSNNHLYSVFRTKIMLQEWKSVYLSMSINDSKKLDDWNNKPNHKQKSSYTFKTLLRQLVSFSRCTSSVCIHNCFKDQNKPAMTMPVTSELDMKSLS